MEAGFPEDVGAEIPNAFESGRAEDTGSMRLDTPRVRKADLLSECATQWLHLPLFPALVSEAHLRFLILALWIQRLKGREVGRDTNLLIKSWRSDVLCVALELYRACPIHL